MAREQAPQQMLQRAFALFQQGRLADAEKLARRALRQGGPNAQLLQFVAVLCTGQDKHAEAVRLCTEAVRLAPQSAEAHYNLGTALMRLERGEEAVASLQKAIAILPGNYDALNNLGFALLQTRRIAEAEAAARRAIALAPKKAAAYHTLGVALRFQDRYDEAIASLELALASGHSDPDEVRFDLGQALLASNRVADAIAQFRDLLGRKPKQAKYRFALAEAEADAGLFQEAAASYEAVLALAPDDVPALVGLANARQQVADWRDFATLRLRIARAFEVGSPDADPFTMLTLFDDPALHRRSAQRHAGKHSAVPMPAPANPRKRPDKLRVAYLSSDFRVHATSVLMAGLFEHHDRSRYETIAISWGRDDGSDLRRRVVAGFDRFIDVRAQSADQAARVIREQAVDVAVDLNGYIRSHRDILARRPAPIQVNYLGYPGTMGAKWIDYILIDPFVIAPEAETQFTEAPVYLPHSYQANDDKRAEPGPVPPRGSLGLPAAGFVFASFNSTHKITPDMFAIWLRLLQAAPGSVLWLLRQNDPSERNLRRTAANGGVDPDRLIFAPTMPYHDHISRLQCADLVLDTLPYNGHTTASDALWAGVPVLTCPGRSFPARVAGSLLHAVELPQLVAPTLEDYEAKALAIASDPQAHATLRAELQRKRRTAPLFDTARFTRHLEAAYESMWQRWASGEAPAPIRIHASAA
jgi:protein O-GlcNAc transferase